MKTLALVGRQIKDLRSFWPRTAKVGLAMRSARAAGKAVRLVMLDVNMPEMDGFAVAEQIRDDPALAGATIMMLSSAARRGDARRVRELDIATYLSKPIVQSTLLDSIMTALGSTAGVDAEIDADHSEEPCDRPLHVLVAEDNPVNQKLVVRLLEKWGHRVEVAVNGRKALESIARERFDLVLMDVQMPEMSGLEATAVIREQEVGTGEHLPVIALTANAMKGDREDCLAAGADGYMPKPLDPESLRAEISRVLQAEPAEQSQEAEQASVLKQAAAREIFDLAEAMGRLEGDADLLHEVVGLVLEDCPQQMATIARALAAGHAEALSHSAHSLKGAVGSIAAKAAFEAAMNLECAAREGDMDRARGLEENLRREVARLLPLLSEFADQTAEAHL